MTTTKLSLASLLVFFLLSPVVVQAHSHAESNDVVSSFPWITQGLGNHKSKVEQAYAAGMMIQRMRDFFADDSRTTLVNYGAGPRQYSNEPTDLTALPEGTGTFGIFVAFEPADVELYRELLPRNFDVPATPEVSMVVVDYNQPNPVRRYKEGMVMLKALASSGEETWYVHSMPVEDWLMLAMGHDWGFRKELFDMVVASDHASVHRPEGDLFFALELTDQSFNDAKAVVPEGGAGGLNNMAVIYPPDLARTLIFSVSGDVLPIEKNEGMVRISVGEDVDWAGLVPPARLAPGYFQRYIYDRADGIIKKM